MVNCYDVDYCDDDHNNDDDFIRAVAKIIVIIIMIIKVMRIDHDNGVCEANTIVTHTTKTYDVYNKLKFYYIGMESDFCNCLRIDDLLMPLNKRTKKLQIN